MKEMIFRYEPLKLAKDYDGKDCRVNKGHFAQRVELEAQLGFLEAHVVSPFEEALKESPLSKLDCGDFAIEINREEPGVKLRETEPSWKSVYQDLRVFLEIRADDSRVKKNERLQKDLMYLDGVGYCISIDSLLDKIRNLEKISTPEKETEVGGKVSVTWPEKKKEEKYQIKISLPDNNYRDVSKENGIIALETKRFCSGAGKEMINPFYDEVERWFRVVTGYKKGDIPNEKIKMVERTLEFDVGSYEQVQLIRVEEPLYGEAVDMVRTLLKDIKNEAPVQKLKHMMYKGQHFVNIKSVYEFLSLGNLENEKLRKVKSRLEIVP